MKIARTRVQGTRASGFRALAWLVLLAFSLQSFITQTHIHGRLGVAGDIQVVKSLAKAPAHDNNTPAENTADCPFCQAITHAGAFFTPTAPALILPVALTEMLAPIFVAGVSSSFSSHPWQSRAPPRH